MFTGSAVYRFFTLQPREQVNNVILWFWVVIENSMLHLSTVDQDFPSYSYVFPASCKDDSLLTQPTKDISKSFFFIYSQWLKSNTKAAESRPSGLSADFRELLTNNHNKQQADFRILLPNSQLVTGRSNLKRAQQSSYHNVWSFKWIPWSSPNLTKSFSCT